MASSPASVRSTALPPPRRLLTVHGDDRLVDQVRRGSEAAFEVIYERHHLGILSFARQIVRSREEAEDVVQHTFVSAYRDLTASDKPIKLKPWLYTIARNRSLSVLRAKREQASEAAEPSTAGLSEEVERRADLRRLLADLGELPERQRSALVLAELDDLSHAEIAEILGCDPSKVKSLVYQARSALIESREARLIPCAEVREEIATLRGGALRRGRLRRHLKVCPRCAEYREQVRRQRQMVAVLLPVVPSFGLKRSTLAAAGLGGVPGGAAVASGGGAAGGALGGAVAHGGAAKVAVALVALGAAGAAILAGVENASAPSGGSTTPADVAKNPARPPARAGSEGRGSPMHQLRVAPGRSDRAGRAGGRARDAAALGAGTASGPGDAPGREVAGGDGSQGPDAGDRQDDDRSLGSTPATDGENGDEAGEPARRLRRGKRLSRGRKLARGKDLGQERRSLRRRPRSRSSPVRGGKRSIARSRSPSRTGTGSRSKSPPKRQGTSAKSGSSKR